MLWQELMYFMTGRLVWDTAVVTGDMRGDTALMGGTG